MPSQIPKYIYVRNLREIKSMLIVLESLAFKMPLVSTIMMKAPQNFKHTKSFLFLDGIDRILVFMAYSKHVISFSLSNI